MIRKGIISLFFAGMVLIVFFRGALMNEIDDARVNPDLQQRASVADAIAVEFLNKPLSTGENMRYLVNINSSMVTSPFHALNVDGKKTVLRDDGQGADDVAGDKVYSIYAFEDFKDFQRDMENRQKMLLSGNAVLFTAGRSIRPVKGALLQKVRQVDFNNIRPGTPFSIPMEFFGPVSSSSVAAAATPIIIDHSLMITDPTIIEDPNNTFDPCVGGNPNGLWTFWELMRQMASTNPGSIANDATTSNFILDWLQTWLSNVTVNSDVVLARPQMSNIIQGWEGSPGGQLEPKLTPFKLIGIVNRIDLRGNSSYGGGDAGEVRFVYQLMQGCGPQRFLVILEYGINKPKCDDLHAYAKGWAELSTMPIGSNAYITLLENLTAEVTKCGKNPAKPNENCINQVRTDEISIANNFGWRLNEFHLESTGGSLKTATVARNPEVNYNINTLVGPVDIAKVQMFAAFANANEAQIKDDTYDIPLTHPISGNPFLGAKSITGGNPNHFWDAEPVGSGNEIVNDTVRHLISLNTCGGCHGGESRQGGPLAFTHMELNGLFPASVQLSAFLTGGSVNDPAGRGQVWNFNDLLRRQLDLQDFVDNGCGKSTGGIGKSIAANPVKMTH